MFDVVLSISPVGVKQFGRRFIDGGARMEIIFVHNKIHDISHIDYFFHDLGIFIMLRCRKLRKFELFFNAF